MSGALAGIPARGRWALVGCLVCQIGLGTAYVFSPILKTIVAEFEWSRAAFSLGRAPLILAMSLSFPVVGALADRYGPRFVLSGCTVLLGASFGLMSRMDGYAEFLLLNAMLGFALAGLGDIVVGAVAAQWVTAGRGLVLGIVYTGSNIGGTIVPLLAARILESESWRLALMSVAVGAVVLILPFAAFAVRGPASGERVLETGPADRDGGTDLDLGQALRTRSFWLLAGVLFAFYFYYVAIIEHLVPHLTDIGYSNARAAASLSFSVALGIGGKLAIGMLADRIATRTATLLNFALLTLASFLLLAVGTPGVLPVFLVLQGFATAAENVLLPLMVAECFGVRHLARIYGALMLALFAGVLGQVFAGAVFDQRGSYELAFVCFAVLNVGALVALAGARDERSAEVSGAMGAQWT